MTDETTEPRSARQAYLIGPTLYLRPIELADAATAPIWDPSPYPAPVEVVEERIKEKLGDDVEDEMQDHRLLICRVIDDRPIGSINFNYFQGRECAIGMNYDPNRSLDDWAAIWSEVMTFTVPWLIEERHMMIVLTTFFGEHPLVMKTAATLGLRQNFRMREATVRNGQRSDWIGFEALHPGWVKRLGMPRGMEEGPDLREIRSPARTYLARPWRGPGERHHRRRPTLSPPTGTGRLRAHFPMVAGGYGYIVPRGPLSA